MNTLVRTSWLILVLSCVWGCHHPRQPSQPPAHELYIHSDQLNLVWDETIDVLREQYFIPDFLDRRSGVILTYPTLSRQWFEFWRDDVQGRYEVAESSIHNIRRIVRVSFIPEEDQYRIQVDVRVQRKNQPERQVTTASGAFLVFRERVPLTTGQVMRSDEIVTWVDVGDDVKLANYLLRRIERRLPEYQLHLREPVPET